MPYDIDMIFGKEHWMKLDGYCENNDVYEETNWIENGLWWFGWLYTDLFYDLDDLTLEVS